MATKNDKSHPITVYFDGLCRLCNFEISHYRKMKGAQRIRFCDITATEFDAKAEGVDPVEVHKVIHVKDADGRIYLGVDAFTKIWKELEPMRFLVPIADRRPVRLVLDKAYLFFAKIRPLLPRKSCHESPYCRAT